MWRQLLLSSGRSARPVTTVGGTAVVAALALPTASARRGLFCCNGRHRATARDTHAATPAPAPAPVGSARQFTTSADRSAPADAATNASLPGSGSARPSSLPPLLSHPPPSAAARLALERMMQAEWLREQLDLVGSSDDKANGGGDSLSSQQMHEVVSGVLSFVEIDCLCSAHRLTIVDLWLLFRRCADMQLASLVQPLWRIMLEQQEQARAEWSEAITMAPLAPPGTVDHEADSWRARPSQLMVPAQLAALVVRCLAMEGAAGAEGAAHELLVNIMPRALPAPPRAALPPMPPSRWSGLAEARAAGGADEASQRCFEIDGEVFSPVALRYAAAGDDQGLDSFFGAIPAVYRSGATILALLQRRVATGRMDDAVRLAGEMCAALPSGGGTLDQQTLGRLLESLAASGPSEAVAQLAEMVWPCAVRTRSLSVAATSAMLRILASAGQRDEMAHVLAEACCAEQDGDGGGGGATTNPRDRAIFADGACFALVLQELSGTNQNSQSEALLSVARLLRQRHAEARSLLEQHPLDQAAVDAERALRPLPETVQLLRQCGLPVDESFASTTPAPALAAAATGTAAAPISSTPVTSTPPVPADTSAPSVAPISATAAASPLPPSTSESALASPPPSSTSSVATPAGAAAAAVVPSHPSSAGVPESGRNLLPQLRRLRRLKSFTPAEVEAAVSGFADGAWDPKTLNVYLECYGRVPGALQALRTFDLVTGPLGFPVTRTAILLLVVCVLRDWQTQGHGQEPGQGQGLRSDALLDTLRARMLRMAPPLRLKGSDVDNLLRSRCRAPDALVRLHRWALEDEAWATAAPRTQRTILQVVAQTPAPVPAPAPLPPPPAPAPASASAKRPMDATRPVQNRAQPAVLTPAQRTAKLDVLMGTGDGAALDAPLAPVPEVAAAAASESPADPAAPFKATRSKSKFAQRQRQRGGSAYLARFDAEVVASHTGTRDLAAKVHKGAHGHTPTAVLFAQLFRGMAFAFQDDTVERMESLREDMLAYEPTAEEAAAAAAVAAAIPAARRTKRTKVGTSSSDSAAPASDPPLFPLRFTPRHVSLMLAPFCMRPQLAAMLLQWAREDGAFESLSVEKQQRLMAATGQVEAIRPAAAMGTATATTAADRVVVDPASTATATVVATTSATATVAKTAVAEAAPDAAAVPELPAEVVASTRLLQELRQLRDSASITAADIEDVAAKYSSHGSSVWTLPALLGYLACYTRVPGAAPALRMFRRMADEWNRAPTVACYSMLLQCLARDWNPAHLSLLDELRGQMLSAQPAPLRFNKVAVQKLHECLLVHPHALLRLWVWAGQDGVMTPQLQNSVDAAVTTITRDAPAAPDATDPAASLTDWATLLSQQPDALALCHPYVTLCAGNRVEDATRILAAHESLHGALDAPTLAEWIRACRESVPPEYMWAAAAPLWQRIESQSQPPSRATVCSLLEICMQDGSEERLRLLDALFHAVHGGPNTASRHDLSHVVLARPDFERLLLCARQCDQVQRVRAWTGFRSTNMFQRMRDALQQLEDLRMHDSASSALRPWQQGALGQFTAQDRTVQSQAEAALRSLLRLLHTATGARPLEWTQWELIFERMLHHQLYDFAMPFYFAMMQAQRQMRLNKQRNRTGADGPEQEGGAPSPMRWYLRVPASCSTMMLRCVVHSSAATTAQIEPQHAGDHPLPPAGLAGVELAHWLLEQMQSPALSSRIDPPRRGKVLLREMDTAVRRQSALPPGALRSMRAFYDSIDGTHRTMTVHALMHASYVHGGMLREAAEIQEMMRTRHERKESILTARLTVIRKKIDSVAPVRRTSSSIPRVPSAQETELLGEAQSLWQEATRHPTGQMSHVLVGSMLKLYHLRSLPAQLAIFDEALQLETRVAEQGRPQGVPVFTPRAAPVFVDASSFAQLFDSLALSPQAADYVSFAASAHAHMCERHAAAASLLQRERARQLEVGVVARNTYLKFLQRTGQTEAVKAAWAAMSQADKEGNTAGALVVLNAFARTGEHEQADRFAAQLSAWRIPLTVGLYTAWLASFSRLGAWREAEQLWGRQSALGVRADARVYMTLMLVYMDSRDPAQVSKIRPLYNEMRSGSGAAGRPLAFGRIELDNLVRCARQHGLTAEADRWMDLARDIGLHEQFGKIENQTADTSEANAASGTPRAQPRS